GVVDSDSGEIIYTGPTIKNYRGTNFKANIEADFQIPVQVHNELNAALLGEQWQGAVKDQSDVYCITLGTGIGGAYFRDQLVTGASFKAGEIGYLLYDAKTDTTYEQRASTSALKQKAENIFGSQVNVIQLIEKAKANDKDANQMIDSWSNHIAAGLAYIIIIVDPPVLLIGGGVSKQGYFLLEKIEPQINNFLPKNFNHTV